MVTKLKTQYYRWTKIDDEISKGRFPNAHSIAEQLEVSSKTIRRDIEYLRSMLEAPIEYDASHKGYFYTEKWSLGSIRVTGREYLALLLSSRVFAQYRNTPYYASLEKLYAKMKEFLSEAIEIDPDLFETTVLFFGGPVTSIPEETWTVVMNALREKKALCFDYTRPGALAASRSTLETYRVVGYRGDWYCVGRCQERKAIRIYSMARMSGLEFGGPYVIPKGFKIKDHVAGNFGMFLEETEYKVEIEFDAESAPYIKERIWGRNQEIRELAKGAISLSFTCSSLVELAMWVLSHGSHARVVSPRELVERVREEIAGMGKQYKGKG
jgi:predicted DNA-binding transcriptional regulator YafY